MPDDAEITYEAVMNALKVTRSYIDTAKDKGIDVNKASELFKLARPALQNSQLDIAMDHAKKAQKEVVMESLQDTWSKILRLKEDGKDITDAKQIFSKARITIKTEDFEQAFALMEQALTNVRESAGEEKEEKSDSPAAVYQQATEKLQETFSRIREAKEDGKDVTEAESEFKKAREIIKTKDYEKAITICKSVIGSLSLPQDQIKMESEDLVAQLSKDLEEILEFGYGSGAEKLLIREVEDFVNNAKKNMTKKNFKMALSFAQKAQNSLEQLETKFISKSTPSIILSAQSTITDAKSRGIDVKYEEDILEQAQNANNEKKFILARNLAKKAEESIKSAHHKQKVLEITEDLNPLRKLIQDAQAVELNTRKLERHVKNIETAMEEKNYGDAEDSLAKAKEFAEGIREKLKGQTAKFFVERLEKRIGELEGSGIEGLDGFKTGLEEARAYLEKDQQTEAANLVEDIESKIKEASLKEDLANAREIVVRMQGKLEGPTLPPDKKVAFISNLDDLKKADASGDYAALVENAPALLDKLDAAIEEYAAQMEEAKGKVQADLDEIVEIVQLMVQSETDVSDLMDDLNEAKQSLESGDLDKTCTYVEKVNTGLDPKAIEKLQALREVIATYKMNGMDTGPIEDMFINLQPMMSEKRFKDMFTSIIELNNKCADFGKSQEELRDTILASIEQVQPRLQSLRETGADVNRIDELVGQAAQAVSAAQYGTAQNLMPQILEALREGEEAIEFQEAVELLQNMKGRLVELKNAGTDITEAEALFQQAQPKLKEKDYAGVKELIEQVNIIIEKGPEDREAAEIAAEIEAQKAVLAGLKANGVEVVEPENHLLQAEDSIKNKEVLWAKEYLNKAKDELEVMGGAAAAAAAPPPEPAPPEQAVEEQITPPQEPAPPEPEARPEQAAPPPPGPPQGSEIVDPQAVIKELSACRQEILDAKNQGRDIAAAEELFKAAEPLLRTMDLKGCMDVVNKVRQSLEGGVAGGSADASPPAPPEPVGGAEEDVSEKKATIQEAISSIESVIGEFDKMGASTDTLNTLLSDAKSALDSNDLDRAMEMSTQGIEEIENIQEMIPVIEALKTLESTIKEAKDMGADVDRAFELYVEAQDAVAGNDAAGAKNLIARAQDLAESARNIAKVLVTMPNQ